MILRLRVPEVCARRPTLGWRQGRQWQCRAGTRRRLPLRKALVADDDKGGTGVLEKPGIDFARQEPDKLDPGYGSGERQRKKGTGGGRHRLILLDSAEHTESSVVKGITLVVQLECDMKTAKQGTTEEHARNCYNTSRQLGQAIITSALFEVAEFYSEQLYRRGVRTTIEPDTTTL